MEIGKTLTKMGIIVGLAMILSIIAIFLSAFGMFVYNSIDGSQEDVPDKPFLTTKGFPFKLTYELDGETKMVEDKLIFKFDRFYNEGGSKKINWESSLKSEIQALTLLNLNETVKTENEEKRITSLYFAHNPASSFMGGSEQTAYSSNDKDNLWYTYEIKKWDDTLKKSISLKGVQKCPPEQAWGKYRLKIISFESAPPLEN